MKKVSTLLIVTLFSFSQILAQGNDHYDQSSKIYTVVACVAVILIGIAVFLFFLERRVTKLEKDHEQLE